MQWKCVTRTESFAFISSVHDHWQPIPNGQNLWIKVGYLYSYSGIAYNGTIPCIPHIAIIPWKWLDIWYRWPGVKINHHQPIRKHQLLSHTKPTTEGPRDRLEVTMTFFWGSLNLSSCNWLPIFPSSQPHPAPCPEKRGAGRGKPVEILSPPWQRQRSCRVYHSLRCPLGNASWFFNSTSKSCHNHHQP